MADTEFSYAVLTFLRNNYSEAWIYKSDNDSHYLYGAKDDFVFTLKVVGSKLENIEVTDTKLTDLRFKGMNDYINELKKRMNIMKDFKEAVLEFFMDYTNADELEHNQQYDINVKALMLQRMNENVYNDLKRSITIIDSND